MGRSRIGPKKKESQGFSCDPDVLADARATAKGVPLSAIIESLLRLYVANPDIIKEA